MSKKIKTICLYGLVWGVPFALVMCLIREIQGRGMAFGSFPVLLAISIVAGMICGLIVYKKE